MYFDKTLMSLDGEAFNATPKELDLQVANPAKGSEITLAITATGVAGTGTITLKHGDTSPAATTFLTLHGLVAGDFKGSVSIELPPHTKRYVLPALSGFTAGTFTIGVVPEDAVQTNT